MTRNTLLVDLAIAAILTILIVVLSPGLAVVGLIAILVVLICVFSFVRDVRRTKKRGSTRRRPPSLRELRDAASAPSERPQRRGRPAPRDSARRDAARRRSSRAQPQRRQRPRP